MQRPLSRCAQSQHPEGHFDLSRHQASPFWCVAPDYINYQFDTLHYDIWRLSRQFEFDAEVLSEAIRQTLHNRATKLIPFDELQTELLENDTFEKQWSAFLAKSGVTGPESFHEVLHQIAIFLDPLFERIDRLH